LNFGALKKEQGVAGATGLSVSFEAIGSPTETVAYGKTGPAYGFVGLADSRTGAASGQLPPSSLFCRNAGRDRPIGKVVQSDEMALHVRVDAELCEAPKPSAQTCGNGCPVVERVTAEVWIPFGWRQFPETASTDIVTPGVQEYIDSMPTSLDVAMRGGAGTALPESDIPAEENGGAGGFGTGSDAGAGATGQLMPCACTCDARRQMETRAQAIGDDPGLDDAGKLEMASALMACATQCQTEYTVCAMDEANAERDAEEAARAAREERISQSCDCSCAGVIEFDRRAQALQDRAASGQAVSMEDLIQMTTCATTCQTEYMNCRLEQLR